MSILTNRMPFKDEFNEDQARDFYISVRCGLLHEARTKNGWTIWAKHGSRIIDATGAQKILYRDDFQKALCLKPKGGFLSRSWNLSEHFRCYFAMGKIRGTPCMWRHISAHGATTKYISNSFVFNTKIEKEGLPGDSPAGLGAGGLRFKSGRPDQNISRIFLGLSKFLFIRLLHCGILPDRRSGFASRFDFHDFSIC